MARTRIGARLGLAAMLMACAASAFAQGSTSSVSGTVVDSGVHSNEQSSRITVRCLCVTPLQTHLGHIVPAKPCMNLAV
jgi:hypothetical protein